MARFGAWSFLLLLFLIEMTTAVVGIAAANCNPGDQAALIEFASQMSDPGKLLASWKEGGNCCQFQYVTCDQQGNVINVTIVSPDFQGLQRKSSTPGKGNLVGRVFSKLAALEVLSFSAVDFSLDVVPTGLHVLRNLQVLFFEYSNFTGTIPADIGGISNLRTLVLRFANRQVTGPIPPSICNLSKLQTLDLSESGFDPLSLGSKTGPIPACIGNLVQLQTLVLEYNLFSGQVPRSLSSLPRLQVLKLSGNKFIGPLPAVGQPGLELLYLQGNQFTGPIPNSYAGLLSLQELLLGGFEDINNPNNGFSLGRIVPSQLSGPFPSYLQNLVNLQVLLIRGTSISGTIPDSFGSKLVNLTNLELNQNKLTGSIPQGLGNTNLFTLLLNDNQLTGNIPASLGNLKSLRLFDASSNLLTGSIPAELSQLTQLGLFNLSSNKLGGPIPQNLGFAVPGGVLDLSYNQLTGSLNPPSLYGLRQLSLQHNLLTSLGQGIIPNPHITTLNFAVLDVHSNQLAGPVPQWVFQLEKSSVIDLSDNRLTSLPSVQFFVAYILNVSFNAITGPIPSALLDNSLSLYILDLSNNQFSGTLDASLQPDLLILNLSKNQLSGPIPPGLLEAPTLDLSYNRFSGSIPSGNSGGPRGGTTLLNLGHNNLTGPIPDLTQTCTGGLLDTVILSHNSLSGPLQFPASCPSLVVYDVSSNQLSGTIPPSVAGFPNLRVLALGSNSFTGAVGGSLASLPSLQVLDLSHNRLSGDVPFAVLAAGLLAMRLPGSGAPYKDSAAAYYRASLLLSLSTMGDITQDQDSVSATNAIDLSYNLLTGNVDPAIGQLQGLHVLLLSHNRFSGTVPLKAIKQIPHLELLDLSFNNFSAAGKA